MSAARLSAQKPRHAIMRAKQRYGVDLVGDDLKHIAEMIQNNEGKFLGNAEEGCTAWEVKYQGKTMRLILDSTFYIVCTFLPPEGPINPRKPRELKSKKIYRAGKPSFVRAA